VPFLLRAIRKNRWYEKPAEPFLASGDVPADPLADLRTDGNCLSVFCIDEDKANLERVLAAYASNRDIIANLDYALIDAQLLEKIGITCIKTVGQLPDQAVNNSWHRDLTGLSGLNLVALAKEILTKGEKLRVSQPRVVELIRTAVDSGHLDANRITPGIREKIKAGKAEAS